jgi:small-conductance mechanosensitive channel
VSKGLPKSGYFRATTKKISDYFARPYNIGDGISISDITAGIKGSADWIVVDFDLYSTTLRLASTDELATLPNGSIARACIFNMALSESARVHIRVNFSVDTPFERIVVLKRALKKFVENRPRVRRWRCYLSKA